MGIECSDHIMPWIIVICVFIFLIYPPTPSCNAPVMWLLEPHLIHLQNPSSVWHLHSIICLRYNSSWARSKEYDSHIECTIQFLPFLYRPAQQTTSPLHNELEGGAAPNVNISQGYQKSFTFLWIKHEFTTWLQVQASLLNLAYQDKNLNHYIWCKI